jgi:hypothetical protein
MNRTLMPSWAQGLPCFIASYLSVMVTLHHVQNGVLALTAETAFERWTALRQFVGNLNVESLNGWWICK